MGVAESYGHAIPQVLPFTLGLTVAGAIAIAMLPTIRLRDTIDVPLQLSVCDLV